MMSFSSPPPPGKNSQHQQQQQRPTYTMAESRIPTARGGATVPDPNGNRAEILQQLSQKYKPTGPSTAAPSGMGGGASRGAPPGGATVGPPMGGGYIHTVPPTKTAPAMNGGPPTSHFVNRPSQAGTSGGPPMGGMSKAPLPGGGLGTKYSIDHSPKMPRSQVQTASPSSPGVVSKHLAASVTAAAVNSPARSVSQPRRLEHSFPINQGLALPSTPLTMDDVAYGNNATSETMRSRSKSAPPSRPPPARGPPTPAVHYPPEASKGVSFPNMSPPTSTQSAKQGGPPPPRVASTPYPGKTVTATLTPEDVPSVTTAGATPYFAASVPTGMPESSDSTTRRDLLRSMREMAETPHKEPPAKADAPTSNGPSKTPELRLHEELSTAQKQRESALRQVTELQEEIIQLRLTSTKQVGFQSPMSPSMGASTPRRRMVSTPFPKFRKVLVSDATSPDTVDDERQLLVEAVERTEFEYDNTDTTNTFFVRRPYGVENQADFWYKAGQMTAKRYVHSADVFRSESIEVAAEIGADRSIFVLFGKDEVRHQTATGLVTEYGSVGGEDSIMGSVSYIDNEANEKDYSLEDLYLAAVMVRNHYCSSVLSFATALKLKSPNAKSPFHPGSPDAHVQASIQASVDTPRPVETADKAVATETAAVDAGKDDVAKPDAKPPKKKAPPVEEESTTDVLASFIQMFFSFLFRVVWFIFIGLPMRILTTTFVMTVSAVLVSFLWLYLADDNGAGALGSSMHVYANQPGIL